MADYTISVGESKTFKGSIKDTCDFTCTSGEWTPSGATSYFITEVNKELSTITVKTNGDFYGCDNEEVKIVKLTFTPSVANCSKTISVDRRPNKILYKLIWLNDNTNITVGGGGALTFNLLYAENNEPVARDELSNLSATSSNEDSCIVNPYNSIEKLSDGSYKVNLLGVKQAGSATITVKYNNSVCCNTLTNGNVTVTAPAAPVPVLSTCSISFATSGDSVCKNPNSWNVGAALYLQKKNQGLNKGIVLAQLVGNYMGAATNNIDLSDYNDCECYLSYHIESLHIPGCSCSNCGGTITAIVFNVGPSEITHDNGVKSKTFTYKTGQPINLYISAKSECDCTTSSGGGSGNTGTATLILNSSGEVTIENNSSKTVTGCTFVFTCISNCNDDDCWSTKTVPNLNVAPGDTYTNSSLHICANGTINSSKTTFTYST